MGKKNQLLNVWVFKRTQQYITYLHVEQNVYYDKNC